MRYDLTTEKAKTCKKSRRNNGNEKRKVFKRDY